MSKNSAFNRFTYVVGMNRETELELITWVTTSIQYINQYFEGDRRTIIGTRFGDCVSKIDYLTEALIYSGDADKSTFRGVRDKNGRLQAAAIISSTRGMIYPYNEEINYLFLDTLTTPPWNCLSGVTLPQKVKGAATWLMTDIVLEFINTEIGGVIKLSTIDRAKTFYEKVGFESDPSDEREMILTRQSAQLFIRKQLRLRGTENDTNT